ncbi:glycoside hydrolase family 31 protein [Lactobacillus sp. ESL0791]|uniref:SLAP domain-containing protein n=1 Tax=Lactobacillus sp. ESL0791 TaxID=2983234 RepID=UPI0023F72CB0|nr:SLAP domain-containing protein [Lactobacillus sp. ESL0791]MDF7639350.1 glycoside hydrolase family 31 protein [Lactobacillus sp. ESL0791]
MTRNNKNVKQKFAGEHFNTWSIRHLGKGAASVAIATGILYAVLPAQTANAATTNVDKQTRKTIHRNKVKKQFQTVNDLTTNDTETTDTNSNTVDIDENKTVDTDKNKTVNADVNTNKKVDVQDEKSDPAVTDGITSITKQDKYFEITYNNGQVARLYILNNKTFRYYVDPTKVYGDPVQSKDGLNAKIFADDVSVEGTDGLAATTLESTSTGWSLNTGTIVINFDKTKGTMSVNKGQNTVLQETKQVEVKADKTTETLKDDPGSHYYGGGTQNGKFNLDRENVRIVNTNNWVDGGVASPNPFYWSTKGYGVLRNTFRPGNYDFDTSQDGTIATTHNENRFDAVYFFDDRPYDLIHDYQELTGEPALTPIYGFYEAHLNAYNRDYWVKVDSNTQGAIKYPDGNYYKEYQPDALPAGDKSTAIRETLNGEKGGTDYQFSARAMLDQYLSHEMPIGWFLPNDGYGAGYGQTNTLEGNIQNLKDFITYANSKGVQVGLWTQQNLSPVDPANPQPTDRDFEKEVEAGVVALKTDVVWVGYGYSFGLNATQTAANMIKKIKGDAVRPFIVSLDGWAGTQNTAAVWTGDETGGKWEYIRFQIPTYIGEGLSGQPNAASDMDAIFGGGDPVINAREYEWKAFTPIQLNMDGWGTNPKNPFAFDDKNPNVTKINRAYLKQKTMLMPYIYSMASDATTQGKPMVRAMFLDYPNEPEAYTDLVKYQYMWGDNLLIAPIYQNTAMKANGDDVRNGIYLPNKDQVWIDYYTGKEYQGGQVINNFDAPLWKLPVFIKAGAILPTAPATNTPNDYLAKRNQRQFQIYPSGSSEFNVYEDDGISAKYKEGSKASTLVKSVLDGNKLTINVAPTTGNYDGMDKNRTTEFAIRTKKEPTAVTAKVGGQTVTLTKATSLANFNSGTNVYYYDQHYLTNSYLSDAGATGLDQSFLRIKLGQTDVSQNSIQVNVEGIDETPNITNTIPAEDASIKVPTNVKQDTSKITPTAIGVTWDAVTGATSYNVKADGVVYTGLTNPNFVLSEIKPKTEHTFQVQTVTANGVSAWSEELKISSTEDPLKNAVQINYDNTISGDNTRPGLGTTDDKIWQSGYPVKNLFDHDLTTMSHTLWYPDAGLNATPLTITAHLNGITNLDKLVYVPRDNAGNGNISGMNVQTSIDGIHWNETDASGWNKDASQKEIKFAPGTKAYYLKFTIPAGVTTGNFFSGQEILLYQKDGTDVVLPGDITGDHTIDSNDETSLHNYVGETKGEDNDFDGYVENGDLNQNGVIDAFDIDYVMTQVGDRANFGPDGKIVPSGKLTIKTDKTSYKRGDTITVTVSGFNLNHVNALSSCLPYDKDELEFESIENGDLTSGMVSFAKNKTHSDGSTDVYVDYSNRGEAPRINNGYGTVAVIKFKALEPINGRSISFVLGDQMLANQYAMEYEPADSRMVTVRVKSEDSSSTGNSGSNGSSGSNGGNTSNGSDGSSGSNGSSSGNSGSGSSNGSSGNAGSNTSSSSTGSGSSNGSLGSTGSNTSSGSTGSNGSNGSSGNNSNGSSNGSSTPSGSNHNHVIPIAKEKKRINHNAYVYDNKGTKIKHSFLKAGEKVVIQGIVTIKGKKFYDIGNDQYIIAKNIDGTKRKLRHNAFVYNSKGKRIKHKVLKKNVKVKVYGSAITIKHHKYYVIGKGRYIKVNNIK